MHVRLSVRFWSQKFGTAAALRTDPTTQFLRK